VKLFLIGSQNSKQKYAKWGKITNMKKKKRRAKEAFVWEYRKREVSKEKTFRIGTRQQNPTRDGPKKEREGAS